MPLDYGKSELYIYRDTSDTVIIALVCNTGTTYYLTHTDSSLDNILDNVLNELYNEPDGILKLDNNNHIPINYLPGSLLPLVGKITGNKIVVNYTTNYYNIVNYSTFKNYTVTTSNGIATINNNQVIYTAPDIASGIDTTDVNIPPPEDVIITLNGHDHHIQVIWPTAYVATPTITSPVNNAINLGPGLTITSNAFSVVYGNDTHLSSDWELATDTNFNNIVVSSYNDTTNKTNWYINYLDNNTIYYIRVRHRGTNLGYSPYSVYNKITTKVKYVVNLETYKLNSSNYEKNDNFGYAVSISDDGTRVAIGAPYTSTKGLFSAKKHGAVYIFHYNGTSWTEEAILVASDKSNDDHLGYSVHLDSTGTRVLAGATEDSTPGILGLGAINNHGSVYVFSRSGTTWTEEAKLEASSKVANERLGSSVSCNSDCTKLVTGGRGSSSIYLYTRSGTSWTQRQRIASSGGLGTSVSVNRNGDRVIAGAPTSTNGQANIYTLSSTTLTLETTLTASDGASGDSYGTSVSMDTTGTRVAIGSPKADPSSLADAGKAYVYVRSGTTWSQEAIIEASDKATNNYFGTSVSISEDGTRLLIGAPNRSSGGISKSGGIYAYVRSNNIWYEEHILSASDKAENNYFGFSVDINEIGTRAIVGAYNAAVSGKASAGCSYIFD